MNKAIDEVRTKEAKELKAKGQGEVLKGARWTLLKRPENRTPAQEVKLADAQRQLVLPGSDNYFSPAEWRRRP